MKKVLLVVAILFCGFWGMSQNTLQYIEVLEEVLQKEKKAAIAEVMMLTEEESKPFWKLYNKFNKELVEIESKRIDLIKKYMKNFENLTEDAVDDLWESYFDIEEDRLDLFRKYYKKFRNILPKEKAARYFQAENKVAALINYELADEVPFIDVK
jgi:hypothetical protein